MSCASSCDTGYPSSARTTRGVTTKIDATAANESWKPASKSAYGFQPRSTAAPTSSACHRSRSRPGEPGERAEGGGERRAHDGRMEPDGERVRRDRGERRELGDVDSEAEEQYDGCRSTADRGDLQPVHREAVVEARGPEVGEEALIHAGAPPENDRLDHVASLALESPRGVAAQPAPDAVTDAGDSPAPPDDPKRLSTQNRVDALPAQPRRLVEAVRRPGWSLQLAQEPQPCPLRRRASERELEEDRLVDAQRPPAEHERLHPLVEAPRSRRLLDLDVRPLRGTDPGREDAVVELSQSHAPPAQGDGDDAPRPAPRRASASRRLRGRRQRARRTRRASAEPPDERGSREQSRDRARRRMRAGGAPSRHGITSPFSCAMCAGPMPGTPSSSATAWNAPCACR